MPNDQSLLGPLMTPRKVGLAALAVRNIAALSRNIVAWNSDPILARVAHAPARTLMHLSNHHS
jgi:hypothetical protein